MFGGDGINENSSHFPDYNVTNRRTQQAEENCTSQQFSQKKPPTQNFRSALN